MPSELLDPGAVLDRIGIGVAVLGRELELRWANAVFASWFPRAAVGTPLPQTSGPWAMAPAERLLRATAREGTDFERIEVCHGERAGEQRSWLLTARSIQLGQERPELVLLIEALDGSRWGAAPERRRQRQVLQALAVELAQEFSNVLVGVLGYASIAERELEAGSRALASVQRVHAAASRALALTQRLLMFSGRTDPGAGSEAIDLSRLVADAARRNRQRLPGRVLLETPTDPPPVRAVGDARVLDQVLDAILDDVVERIGEGPGVIRLAARRSWAGRDELSRAQLGSELPEGGYARVEVRDPGRGIGLEEPERIPDPFFAARYPGRGLGLAAAAGALRSLGGALVISHSPEDGATFSLLLPAPEEPAAQAEAARFPAGGD